MKSWKNHYAEMCVLWTLIIMMIKRNAGYYKYAVDENT